MSSGESPGAERQDGANDLDELGYEAARDELADVVRALEAGGLSLEESLALWERGEALANVCERHLAGARERIETALAVVTEAVGNKAVGNKEGEGEQSDSE
ncbi:MAG: exodeoxyribonuclease VII small subunit [Pseudonocardiaceae bacterium]|nr:exodeoxyribonuclease VII small subunit [Pseudonocardiaceae bacterium]